MCRLFGFRSMITSQVHSSLVTADKSFMHLSQQHPDGWGVAYYIEDAPHVVKSESSAIEDVLFQRVSGIVASNTVLAHLRKATVGRKTMINTHPFQYGRWVFAHNGHIKDFAKLRDQLRNRISKSLSRFIIGETDSEWIFYWVLEYIYQHRLSTKEQDPPIAALLQIVKTALKDLMDLVGAFHLHDSSPEETYLTFILTNGNSMIAHHGGKSLYYSTYKSQCPDRKTCSYFSANCEQASLDGQVKHLVLSSEPIQSENIWQALQPGDLIGLDANMILTWAHSLRS